MMIAYAIVLYNKNIEDSNTFFFLKSCVDKSQILVFDNSDNPEFCLNNEKKCKNEGITYLSQNENIGLSRAYNCILNNIFAESKVNFTYICWLDDDTILESKFLKEQEEAVNEKYDIFVPKIKGQDGIIYSPNEAGFIKNKLVVSQNHVPKFQKFNAINS
ncbi:glycosyltransferase, partial [Lactovum odontotermitis]